ncbi:nucleotidyltransferase family protein [Glaciimonas sp. Gout2]|uniref:N-acetylmuramate alpha-1-phosphate uridylyltransferase MurU n=1 Tax=unclassified Glaciimonas TaxID=2644401 RepID=UPI002AB3C4D5|nr:MULTISPECIES: nucleotidyltransferase family protein [unclassified Glaciimonas]MDY7545151.1 nucleotidyltransferase family protein [Glaciimonas sp. CA11.2]MEB0011351.1 nucleotidyltransferase family protein [Glaciimonas sp. Cout2]MEB0081001.1 nucleotidyltransferase family protein [Glaciimonas sp. Gout2]
MKAMIFAAGRGERMRPLTDTTPKPLLKVRGRPLIVWHIVNLVRAGITDIIINHAHLGQLIEDTIGDGSKYGAKITYSAEGTALETAGAVAKARHLLGDAAFVAVSADIYCPYFNFEQVKTTLEDNDLWGVPHPIETRDVAWLYLVKNPAHHPEGDFVVNSFSVSNKGNEGEPRFTYSGIGVFRPMMFDSIAAGEFGKLAPILRQYADLNQIGGEVYRGDWTDVGTIARLEQLNAPL